ncbi:serine/threonine-protein kinase [Haloferula sargassicola]|uniref:Serine/threonine-protein kinase PknD n=1 Tax=Haloferula sargassicola TaxID=490096 RepID=A0ABP9UJL0_9BACT
MSGPIDKLLFDAAAGLTDPDERRAFLDHTCREDPALRTLLEEMLEVRDEAEDFFTFPQASGNPPPAAESRHGAEENVGTSIGRYRLIERLGEGGGGVVYLAEQQEPVRRKVALKIIRLGMDTESVIARFEIERQALALMDHPNIARVLDAGATATGRPYFVMELADGERITAFCDHQQLGLRDRLGLFVQVCEAIQHAHQKGVIHRDIKPSNVLVRRHEGRLVPKVIDFGIAKVTATGLAAEGTATRPGQFIGTPAYMSPEQAEGGVDIDTRSDIYSLGALLYELLTGSPPVPVETDGTVGEAELRERLRRGVTETPSARVRKASPAALAEIARQRGVDAARLPGLLAGDLDGIVMKAIDRDRPRRYETANGLALDVQRYLAGQPVIARPPSRWYLLSKLVARNRVVFIAAAIALSGLLGGFGVSTWLFFRERSARHEQAKLRVQAEQATANEVRLRENAQVADLVRQAAVHLKYGEDQAADELLAGLPATSIPASLEASSTLMNVAEWNLAHGRWQAASERFFSLGHVVTSVDMSDSQDISFRVLSVLTAVAEWGEPGQYDELRQLTIDRFGDSSNPVVAEHTVKATLLKPADPATLARLAPLVAVLRDSLEVTDDRRGPHMVAWRQFSLALIAYREGRWDDAEERARLSLGLASNSAPREVSNQLLLAMIAFERGREKEARQEVVRVREKVDRWLQEPFQVVNPDGTLWYNQHAALLLLLEAEALVGGAPR